VGKTTLLKELARRLIVAQETLPERIFYFDLDTMDCLDLLSSPRALMDFCNLSVTSPIDQPLTYLLLDEVQRLKEPGLFLKTLYDLELPLRVTVTGSSSLDLRTRVRQSLVGRSTSLHLWPLTPPELPMERPYLNWGGFPEVVLAPDDLRRREYLADMWAAYVDRELGGFLHLQKTDRFRDFAVLLADQVGQMVNLNEMASTLTLSRDTLVRYLSYLEDTFLIRVLRPFIGNRRGELTKMPKVFFTDLGLLNLLSGATGGDSSRQTGPRLENAVEIILRSLPGDLYFWRTDRGAEVDFIRRSGNQLLPVEVKAGAIKQARVSRGYRNFIKTYEPPVGWIINGSLNQETVLEKTRLLFMTPDQLPEKIKTLSSAV
jgi:predicted AAA+ superfamily ATPase